jgi:hypothetical protein
MHLPVHHHHMLGLVQGLRLLLAMLLLAVAMLARGQGVELATLQTSRSEGSLNLEFVARVNLPKAVEDALQRGVPIYFAADAQLLRSRWYWRDERVARVSRSWRIAYQPLTNSWRVGLGGLNQTHPTLADALLTASRSAGWKLAELKDLDPDKNYYLEFSYKLDTTQLPGPMQFGLGGQGEWAVGASRTIKVELSP